ncbi:MAG: hypothetical protein IJ421_00320 [Prevotella sp.]|nr:hypothetical protein [Prevotella sp.]
MLDKTGVSKLWAASKGLFVPKEAGKGLSENDFSDSYKGKIDGLTESYTFVVNSDETLLAWANAEAGNDYTHVLIKSGTWNMSKPEGINLTTAGTLTVTGEPGNKIVNIATFDGTVYGLTAAAIAYTDMHITGVHMHVENHATYSSGTPSGHAACCFSKLRNLVKCYATGNNKYAISGNGPVVGFDYCEQIYGCTATATEAPYTTSTFFYGFRACSYLSACCVYTTAEYFGVYAMQACNYITSCYIYVTQTTNFSQGMASCRYIASTEVYVSSKGGTQGSPGIATGINSSLFISAARVQANAYSATAYNACQFLTSCDAYAAGGATGVACYKTCKQVNTCYAECPYNNGGNLRCFDSCTGVQNCYAKYASYNSSQANWFINSSACQDTYDAAYACANTPEGGWNAHNENTFSTT